MTEQQRNALDAKVLDIVKNAPENGISWRTIQQKLEKQHAAADIRLRIRNLADTGKITTTKHFLYVLADENTFLFT